MYDQRNRGISVVEVLIGTTILTLILLGVATAITQFVDTRERLNVELEAKYLAESGYEYVRHLRDSSWSTIAGLTPDTPYYLSVSTTTVTVSGTPEVIDGQLLRRFHIRELYRDSNDSIVASTTAGSSIDDEGYEVWVEVGTPYATTTLRGILTNILVD